MTSEPESEPVGRFETADDIRTELLDSMIYRLQERSKEIKETSWDISEWRVYTQWLLIAAILVIFCILRYGIETVHILPTEERVDDPIIEYKNRQLEKTAEAFRERRHQ